MALTRHRGVRPVEEQPLLADGLEAEEEEEEEDDEPTEPGEPEGEESELPGNEDAPEVAAGAQT